MKRFFHPALLMLIVWACFIAVYFLVPIHYVNTPGVAAWSIMIGGIAIFCAGAVLSGSVPWHSPPVKYVGTCNRIVVICTIAGFAGIAAILADKQLFSGIDWSIGLTAVRERRSVEVMENIQIHRTWLLYLGYLLFSFSCVAMTIFVLDGERLGKLAGFCGQASALPMVAYAVLYGGRMPILLLILLGIGAALTRRVQGKSFLPGGYWLWPKMALIAIAFLLYTNQVWSNRRESNHITSYSDFVKTAALKWEMAPSAWIDRAVENGPLPAKPVMDWLSLTMYLTHSPTTVQRLSSHIDGLSIYAGLYQIGILSPLSDILAPSLKLPQKMRSELMSVGAYGWFPNAWGAWLGDAGIAFGSICVLLWGLLSGLAYRSARESGSIESLLLLTFTYFGIFISPVQGPFGMANSFLIFASFAAVCIYLNFSRRRRSDDPRVSTGGARQQVPSAR
jgi:hypothetical protein